MARLGRRDATCEAPLTRMDSTVPLYRTTVVYHSTVPLYGTTVLYHSTLPLYDTTVLYHSTLPLYYTTVLYLVTVHAIEYRMTTAYAVCYCTSRQVYNGMVEDGYCTYHFRILILEDGRGSIALGRTSP